MTYTDAIKEAYASCPSSVAVIETVEIYHPDWAEVIRLVRDKDNLTATLESSAPNNPSASVVFTALDFQISQPRIGEGRQELTLTIENASRALIPMLETHDLASLDEARVIYRPYLSTDLTGPHMNPPLTLTVMSVTATMQQVSMTCGYADFANLRFPRKVYTVAEFPGLAPRV
jgi:hypothetical protein